MGYQTHLAFYLNAAIGLTPTHLYDTVLTSAQIDVTPHIRPIYSFRWGS